MLANSGLDAANACKQFVDFGLGKKMKLAGINLEDFYYKAVPLDAIAGTTFPVAWTPTCSRRRAPAHRASEEERQRADLVAPLLRLRRRDCR